MSCKHLNFAVKANISRLTMDKDDDVVVGYAGDFTVTCVDCSLPFEFIGLPMGMSPIKPCCSVDALEARLPLKPKGEAMRSDFPGYEVRKVI